MADDPLLPVTAVPAVAAPQRFARLDALRGLAIVWMVLFHLAFDLNHLGFLQPAHNFYRDGLWTLQRTAIVSLFLLCVGLGQAAAQAAGLPGARFWRRWGQVVGCALLVSAGSAVVFPRSWISFGVLHGVAVMLLVVRVVVRVVPRGLAWPLGLGALALAAPRLWQHPWFDSSRLTSWVGLVTHKPVTEDYVPLLPWLGVVLCGLAAGRWLLQHRPAWLTGPAPANAATPPGPLAMLRGAVSTTLATLGRWPLTVYMLHQPLLFGTLLAWRQWRGA